MGDEDALILEYLFPILEKEVSKERFQVAKAGADSDEDEGWKLTRTDSDLNGKKISLLDIINSYYEESQISQYDKYILWVQKRLQFEKYGLNFSRGKNK